MLMTVKYIVMQAYRGSLDELCMQVSMPSNFRVLLHQHVGLPTLKWE